VQVVKRPHPGGVEGGFLPLLGGPLVGRQEALADLRRLLATDRTRLLTLTGPGGTGKSRLALELALAVGPEYGNVWFVDLTTVPEYHLVPGAIAQAIGVKEGGGQPLKTVLQEFLSEVPTLILLDNFEQVLEAASVVVDLLSACPRLTIVVTSRQPLALRSERVYFVEPLAVPDMERIADQEVTRNVPSVQLFVERAMARRAGFRLHDEALPAVAEICVRLDGLPLAIELAAGQAVFLTPAAILKRLQARAPLIGPVQRDLPARHQTLQASVAWSYELLDPAEQAALRRCGVFNGGFSIAAAARVCGVDVLGVLAQLVTKSLVRMAPEAAQEPRFWLLETVREYALDRLEGAGELGEVRSRHAAYYLELAEMRAGSLRGHGMLAVLDELAREYGNFRAVFKWASEVDDLSTGLRLAGALYRFWSARGHLTEARGWLETALTRSEGVPAGIRGAALRAAGVMAGIQHDHSVATRFFQESLEVWETLNDVAGQAGAHFHLGLIAHVTGQVDEARLRLERAFELFVRVGDRAGQARAVGTQARLAREQGDLVEAAHLAEHALQLFQAVGDDWGSAHALANLGHIKLALHDRTGAEVAFRKALQGWRALGNTLDITECLEGVAAVLVDAQPRRAAQLLGSAEAHRQRSGAPIAAVEQSRYAGLVSRVRSHLRDDTFAAAWQEGRRLSMDKAIDLAQRVEPPGSQTNPRDHALEKGVLSAREREIAELIARGFSNRTIAETLVVSIKTIETHVKHIFSKLNVTGRAEVAVWAERQRLI
jgi:predicted ATPase/DNA-binding CsgD family transcriptional regulator